MKRNILWLALCLLLTTNVHALTVSVNGHGDITAQGMEITLTEAEMDPLSGEMRMELKGNLICSTELTVTITRSATDLEDEFCCADQCTSGNGETSETLTFQPNGFASWYIHYAPAANSDETIQYVLSDGTESLTLTVHFLYSAEGVDDVQSEQKQVRKTIKDGILYIEKDNKTYTIL